MKLLEIKAGDYYVRMPLEEDYIPVAKKFLDLILELTERER